MSPVRRTVQRISTQFKEFPLSLDRLQCLFERLHVVAQLLNKVVLLRNSLTFKKTMLPTRSSKNAIHITHRSTSIPHEMAHFVVSFLENIGDAREQK